MASNNLKFSRGNKISHARKSNTAMPDVKLAKKANSRMPRSAKNPATVAAQGNQASQTKKSLSAVIFLSDKSNFIAAGVIFRDF